MFILQKSLARGLHIKYIQNNMKGDKVCWASSPKLSKEKYKEKQIIVFVHFSVIVSPDTVRKQNGIYTNTAEHL